MVRWAIWLKYFIIWKLKFVCVTWWNVWMSINSFNSLFNLQQILLLKTFNNIKLHTNTRTKFGVVSPNDNLTWRIVELIFIHVQLNMCVVGWLATSLFGLFNRSRQLWATIYLICIQLALACENLLHIHTHTLYVLWVVSLTAFFLLVSSCCCLFCLKFKNYYRFVCLF